MRDHGVDGAPLRVRAERQARHRLHVDGAVVERGDELRLRALVGEPAEPVGGGHAQLLLRLGRELLQERQLARRRHLGRRQRRLLAQLDGAVAIASCSRARRDSASLNSAGAARVADGAEQRHRHALLLRLAVDEHVEQRPQPVLAEPLQLRLAPSRRRACARAASGVP